MPTSSTLNDLSAGYDSIEDMIFVVNPQMSYLSPEFVARDAKFWARKPVVAAKTPRKPGQ